MSVFAPWQEQNIVVTGATSGIGKVVTEILLGQGVMVFGVGRSLEKLEALQAQYPEKLKLHHADLLDLKAARSLMALARDSMGAVTGLVAAAGAIEHQSFGSTDDESWTRQMNLNLRVPTILLEESLELMQPNSSAVILGSTLGAQPIATSTAYSAAKAGLEAVVKVAAIAGAKHGHGLRVNLLHPGVVDTPMIRSCERLDNLSEAERLRQLAALHLLGRVAQPAELAQVAVDILTWTFATGSIVTVDGGLSIQS
jgi:NAD(P)-dependent dehydrogenase (short-subunit alcohol dehydrogenase family)